MIDFAWQVDATMFGHLVQFTDSPINSDNVKQFIEQSTPNLVEFVKRMKERYWPDWAEICKTLAMNPEDAVKKEEPVPEAVAPVVATTTTETVTVTQTQEA